MGRVEVRMYFKLFLLVDKGVFIIVFKLKIIELNKG